MSNESLESLKSKIQSASQSYASKASALSSFIVDLQNELAGLPGQVKVRIEKETLYLEWDRISDSSNHWGFWVGFPSDSDSEQTSWKLLVDCDIETKIKCIKLMAELLAKMAELHNERCTELDDALSGITDLLNNAKEG